MLEKTLCNEIIRDLNKVISTEMISSNNEFGLYSGMSGILLYNRYYSFYTDGKEFINVKELNTFFHKLANKSSNSPTLSNGIAGDFWVFNNLSKNGLLEVEKKELDSYNKLLVEKLFLFARNNLWDNLHGAFGIFYYLLEIDLLSDEQLTLFLNILSTTVHDNGTFVFYLTQSNTDKPEKSLNLSLSHGISGQILILTKALNKFPYNKLLISILNEMVMFLLKFKIDKPILSYFPQTIYENKKMDYNNRVSWCYGDLGPGIALYKYSISVNDLELKEKSIEILKFAAQRRGMDECKVFDACICHGTCGNMHIFNRLFFETNILEFENASNYWFEESLNFYKAKKIDGFASKTFDANLQAKNELSTGLLRGLSGIGLALLAKMNSQIEPDWDGCLFIS